MDLPLIGHLSEKGREEPEYFLALEITDSRVKSAVWVVIGNQTEVVTTGTVAYWQGKEVEELVRATDDSLASLAQKLAETTGKEPSKVVLGLPANWVGEDNKIVSEKVGYLKELTKRLDLTLIGFVVTTEALIQYLKSQEGVPPSVILVELAEEEIEVTLVHLGKILGCQRVARSIDLGADLEEGLTRFLPQAIFPSRIIIFDGHASLEEARQQLLDHSWQAKGSRLSFLHLPKVEILSEDETVKAVALSGGAEAAKAIGLSVQEQPVRAEAKKEEQGPEEEAFVAETVVGAEETEETEEETNELADDRSEEFGFVKMGDIREVRPAAVAERVTTRIPEGEPVEAAKAAKKGSTFEAVKRIGGKSAVIIGRLKVRFSGLGFGLAGRVAVVTLALVMAGFLGWWFLAKVTVTIGVQSKTLDKEMTLVLDPGASTVDLSKGVVPVQMFEGQSSGTKSIGATGQKTVGTKAKGSVTIFNSAGPSLSLNAGTLLTSGSGLKFSLDGTVSVASTSGTADNNLTPGQATVGVTAGDVGPEYNLAGGTVFSVPGFTQVQVVAKNADAFSGGDKKEVQAVTKDDLAKLSTQLTDELTQKAKSDLLSKIPSDFQLIEGSLSFKTGNENFDKKVGDEATSASLTESLTADALAMPKSGKQALISSVANNSFPQGYDIDQANSSVELTDYKVTGGGVGSATVDAAVKLVAVPFINRNKLAADLAGKDKVTADSILAKTPGFIREDMKVSPGLFSFLPFLPMRAARITIVFNTR